jgi:hypothetical protein
MNTNEQVRKIETDAFDIDEQLHLAFVDATDALCQLAVRGRSKPEAIKVLESWRVAFERADQSRRAFERARRT